jgi:5-methylcytosine-specific restriction endonuclease McrBC regulatory subunit McrC
MSPSLITVGEWQYVELPPHLDNRSIKERLCRASKLRGGAALKITENKLRATGFVGLISTKDVQIQILPKIYGDTLDIAKGLALTKRLMNSEFFEGTLSPSALTSSTSDQMPEFLAGALINKVVELLRYVPLRRYHPKTEISGTIRGKININYLSRMSSGSALRVEVTHAPLQSDNDLSRLCKAVTTALAAWTANSRQLRTIGEIKQALQVVKDVPLSMDLIRKAYPTRYEEPWAWLLVVAELLLQGERTSLVEGGSTNGLSIAFPVQLLFERQLKQSLTRGLSKTTTRLAQKSFLGGLITDSGGEKLQQLQPDFILTEAGGRVIIGDAKWKHLGKGGRPAPSREDIFQMVTYMMQAGCRTSFFIYPSSEPLNEPIRTDYLRVPAMDADVLMLGVDAMQLIALNAEKQAEADEALAHALLNALALSPSTLRTSTTSISHLP